jgi:hypothetical protein
MKTKRIILFIAFFVTTLFSGIYAQDPYFFEDFQNLTGVADNGDITPTENIIYNAKTTAAFAYPFRKTTTTLIPYYGTGITNINATCAYLLNANKLESDAWMITREIDLTSAQNPLLTFDYACGLYNGIFDFHVQITESFDGTDPLKSTWVDVTEASKMTSVTPFGVNIWPTRLTNLNVDLSAYAGKKIYVAFHGITPNDAANNNPNDPLVYIDNIKVAEKPAPLPAGVYIDESFDNLPGGHSADFTSYNGWWNGKSSSTLRYFKKRMDTVLLKPVVKHCIWVNHNNQKSALSWLISPAIDLTSAIKPELSFEFGFGNDKIDMSCMSLKITDEFEGGAADPLQSIWDDLTTVSKINDPSVVTRHTTTVQPMSVHDIKVDLSAYVGKKIYVCFQYNLPPKSDGTTYANAPVYYIDSFKVAESPTSVGKVKTGEYFTLTQGNLLLTDEVLSADLYTIDGKHVAGTSARELNVSNFNGAYVLKIKLADSVKAAKVIL